MTLRYLSNRKAVGKEFGIKECKKRIWVVFCLRIKRRINYRRYVIYVQRWLVRGEISNANYIKYCIDWMHTFILSMYHPKGIQIAFQILKNRSNKEQSCVTHTGNRHVNRHIGHGTNDKHNFFYNQFWFFRHWFHKYWL